MTDREKPINMADDASFKTKLDKAMNISQAVATAAMGSLLENGGVPESEKGKAGVQAIVLGLAAVIGALGPLAMMMTPVDDHSQPTHDHYLFAALLAVMTANPTRRDDGIGVEFSPHVVAETLDMVEKLTGRKMDGLLLQPMVNAAREMQAEAVSPLRNFMEARSASKPAN